MCPDVTLPALVKELVVFCYKLLGLAIMRYFKEIYTWKFAKTLNLFICRQFYFCGYYKGRSRPSGVLPSLMTSPLGMALTQFKRQLKHHYTKTFLFLTYQVSIWVLVLHYATRYYMAQEQDFFLSFLRIPLLGHQVGSLLAHSELNGV